MSTLKVINPSVKFQVPTKTGVTIAHQPSKMEALEQQFIDLCNQHDLKFSEGPVVMEHLVRTSLPNETELNIKQLERESGIDAEFYAMLNEHVVDDTIEYLNRGCQIWYEETVAVADDVFLLVSNN